MLFKEVIGNYGTNHTNVQRN